MKMPITTLAGVVAGALLAASASAQVGAPTPFLPIDNEPAPKLIADPPIPERLAHGAVVIPYRTENIRILPIFGGGARDVSPRAGHLHVTVDDLPWHWADASDTSTVVVVGLPAGPHNIRIELATPDHHVITGQTVTFTIPDTASRVH